MNDERRRRLRRLFVRAAPIVVAAAILGFWPLPYYIYGPWRADDLTGLVHVKGHAPPSGTLYETSILIVPGRPATYIAAKALPGFEIVPRTDLAPRTMSDLDVMRYMYASQEEGKRSAEIVAARAAGYELSILRTFYVASLSKARPVRQCFRVGDQLVSVDGEAIDTSTTLVRAAERKPLGSGFALSVVRNGKDLALRCTTGAIGGKRRFGISLGEFDQAGSLPFRVSYTLPFYQSGGSTGLMFALQIYRTLTRADLTHGAKVAGTGVLSANGAVLPIVGARQKIIAAKRAGATVFLVPRKNYEEVRHAVGIRVIPVGSFNEAVNWLSWRLSSCPKAATDISSLTGTRFADLPIGDAEKNGIRLPAGVLRLDYGHAGCNLIRFWYFWNDRTHPLSVRFTHASLRMATLTESHGKTELIIVDGAGRTRRSIPPARPDALVAYYISNRPAVVLWTSPNVYNYVGFGENGPLYWKAQPPK